MLDIVIADELRTGLRPPIAESEADWELRAKVWQRPAHRGGWVRRRGPPRHDVRRHLLDLAARRGGAGQRHLLSWEEAVRQLTDVPARLYGLRDRGRLSPRVAGADIVVFDPERVGHGPERTRDDLPGGASRLYAEAEGIEHVIVNGDGDRAQPARSPARCPGAVLRSGRRHRHGDGPGRGR